MIAYYIADPVILMTITVFVGLILGGLKIGRFNFGTSGVMLVGIFLGWSIVKYINSLEAGDELYSVAQDLLSRGIIEKDFFNLFLILFIASVGLLAAKDVGKVIKIYGKKFILLGFAITFIGAASTYVFGLLSPMDNSYLYNGVYTGSLTSSPGLAASLESAKIHATKLLENYNSLSREEKQKILKIITVEDSEQLDTDRIDYLTEEQKSRFIQNVEAGVGTGYAMGYPFGVIIVIFAMNFFPIIFKIDIDKEKLLLAKEIKNDNDEEGNWIKRENYRKIKEIYFDIRAFVAVCIVGYGLGIIKVSMGSLGEISLGSTGGVLIAALILGHIGKIGPFCFRMNSKILGILRKMALAYFFAIVGIKYGYQAINALTGPGFTLVIASIFIGSIAMILGFVLGRYIFKINWIMLSGAICGGMTSTPGLGSAIDAVGSDEPAAGYGAVYPFALLGMVIFSNLLNFIV